MLLKLKAYVTSIGFQTILYEFPTYIYFPLNYIMTFSQIALMYWYAVKLYVIRFHPKKLACFLNTCLVLFKIPAATCAPVIWNNVKLKWTQIKDTHTGGVAIANVSPD